VGVAKQRPRCFARFRQRIQGVLGCPAFGGAHCFVLEEEVQNPVRYKFKNALPEIQKEFCDFFKSSIMKMLQLIY